MLQVASLTLQKVAMLLLFIMIGFTLRKSKKLPENAGKALSVLCTLLFTPAYTLNNLSKNLTAANIKEKAFFLIFGALITILGIFLAKLLARIMAKEPFQRKSLAYAFAIPNYGYFGYPVVEGVFGEAALANMIIFAVPMSIATNSWGYLQFSKEKKLNLKKVLLAPMIIAIVLGCVIGISGLKLPKFITDVLSGAGSCMSPASMLVAGFTMGALPIRKLLNGGKAYLASAIRLIIVPLIFGIPMYLLGLRGDFLMIPLITLALPLGLNLVVYPESYGYDATDNARMCFVSYIMAVIILPLTFALIRYLAY